MGYEGIGDSNVLGMKVNHRHHRSKSFPNKKIVEEDGLYTSLEIPHRQKLDMGRLKKGCIKSKNKHYPKAEVHSSSLEQEILQLEKRLMEQFEVRNALEKALGYRSLAHANTNETPMPKQATDLIKEIAVLEMEVVYLEKHVLSLYRKAFDQKITSASPAIKDNRSPPTNIGGKSPEVSRPNSTLKCENSKVQSRFQSIDNPLKGSNATGGEEFSLDSNVYRCQSALSLRSACYTKTSQAEALDKALRSCHSQPLSMMECSQNEIISLAEHLGTRIADHIPETPNKISEDMIKCMCEIYCRLSDPPLMHSGLSPNSSLSSMSEFSPPDQSDVWSPGCRNNSSFDVRLDNPFHVEGLKEFSGPYSTMVEVPRIHRESQKLGTVEHLLQNFRSMSHLLEDVDPRKLNHEEKLAFWINVHNALVMHAFLAYGIPQNNMKRVFLLLKAAYNVGGHTVSADTIQNSVLGCQMSRPGQWLRMLLPSRTKFKSRDERQAYGIKHPEPLLHFALCSGNHSDPAVRAYTSKGIFQELEAAKEEYIRATFGVREGQKILLPKVVESFMKESSMCITGLMEMMEQSLPESLRKRVRKCRLGNSRKGIEWIPHNFGFRYLISRELVKW